MVIHDYLTTISCDCCSTELQIERNIGEKKMRALAQKRGWRFVDGGDMCPGCWHKKHLPAKEVQNEAD